MANDLGFNDNVVVDDNENWQPSEDNKFNHQTLVMNAIKRCMELGSVELTEGYWEYKVDKNGNQMKTYHIDARKSFINSVKTLMAITNCDYDTEATNNINAILNKMKARRQHWLDSEWRWWTGLNNLQRQQATREGKASQQGFFNKNNDFDNYYFEEEADLYREIMMYINDLTKRLGYYKSERLRN